MHFCSFGGYYELKNHAGAPKSTSNTNQSWSLGQNIRDRDETLTPRDRDLEQKVETRPRRARAETETRHETFGIWGSQKIVNILTVNTVYNIPTNFFSRQNVASQSNCFTKIQKKLLLCLKAENKKCDIYIY